MSKRNLIGYKGVALFLVMLVIFITVLLGNVILVLFSSQSRLTHHQISRIQALYAIRAAMNYTFEKLRIGDWPQGTKVNYSFCQSGCDVNDSDLPHAVNRVDIIVGAIDSGLPGTRKITITANYTYSP